MFVVFGVYYRIDRSKCPTGASPFLVINVRSLFGLIALYRYLLFAHFVLSFQRIE